jgi:hypothetical protein
MCIAANESPVTVSALRDYLTYCCIAVVVHITVEPLSSCANTLSALCTTCNSNDTAAAKQCAAAAAVYTALLSCMLCITAHALLTAL